MSSTRIAAALAGASLIFQGAPAVAQSPAELLAQAGMLGRWSRDCSASSRIMPHISYERVAHGTGAQYRLEFVNSSIVMTIDHVRILSPNTVALRIATLPGDKDPESHDLVIQIEDKRYRAMSSVSRDGKVHIRDGILVASGNASPWQYRCD